MRKTKILLSLLLPALLGLVGWQHHDRQRLRANQADLGKSVAELEALREELARLRKERVDPDELRRLQDNTSELLRLRGQVGQLRRELKTANAEARAAAFAATNSPVSPTPTNDSPVAVFTANATMTVGAKQTMLLGGWKLPSGNRAYMFLQPTADASQNTVTIQARVIEFPPRLGDFELAAGANGDLAGLIGAEQMPALRVTVANNQDVKVLSAPQVVTLNGQQAQVSVTESRTAPDGQTYFTGPVIDVTPTIAPDGQSVQLAVSAQLHVPRNSGPP